MHCPTGDRWAQQDCRDPLPIGRNPPVFVRNPLETTAELPHGMVLGEMAARQTPLPRRGEVRFRRMATTGDAILHNGDNRHPCARLEPSMAARGRPALAPSLQLGLAKSKVTRR